MKGSDKEMRKGIINSKTKVLVLSFFVVLAVVGFASAYESPAPVNTADKFADQMLAFASYWTDSASMMTGDTLMISGPSQSLCNQGVGNGAEMCDPGRSDQGDPSRSNDFPDGVPGNPGRKGGNGK
jgi:hypothetical protein